MNTEKTITLCGKEVRILYCTATENGFEELSDKSISVFLPTFGEDEDGKPVITEPAKANIGDFVKLAIAGIIAAYAKDDQEPPVSTKDILFNTKPAERNELVTAIVSVRNEWYEISKVLEESIKAEQENLQDCKGETPKNA